LEHLPWAHGPEIEEICRFFAELRYRLFPYNYSLAWEAHSSGTPLMRPLVLEYPDDPHAVDMSSQFLWGASLLIAPVTRGGATRWSVYLPGSSWYDFWTHEQYAGGQWVEVAAPLERPPVFVRGGAIVPMGPSMQHSDELTKASSLSLLVYPEGESSFNLYEDDGVSREYENGAYAVTAIRCDASQDAVRLRLEPSSGHYTGAPVTRMIVARIHLPSTPARVSVDGAEIQRVDRREELEVSAPSWWHDSERFLWVAFTQAKDHVEIECAKSN
jgi:alpha-glucosidase